MWGLTGFTAIWMLGLTVFYLTHVLRSRFKTDEKALWALVLLMANAFAMPVYWYLYIWRKQDGNGS